MQSSASDRHKYIGAQSPSTHGKPHAAFGMRALVSVALLVAACASASPATAQPLNAPNCQPVARNVTVPAAPPEPTTDPGALVLPLSELGANWCETSRDDQYGAERKYRNAVDYPTPREAQFSVSLFDSAPTARASVFLMLDTGGQAPAEAELVPQGDATGLRLVLVSDTSADVLYGFTVGRAVAGVQVSGGPREQTDVDLLAREYAGRQEDRLRALLPGAAALNQPGEPAPFCRAGQVPEFAFAPFALIAEQLPDTVGTPLECAHQNPATGDSLQATSAGLAYFRRGNRLPSFTTGNEHWAVRVEQNASSATPPQLEVLHWTGPDPDPSSDAVDSPVVSP